MSRAVHIGGSGNGQYLADKVGAALTRYYEDADVFTFSDAMKRPEAVELCVRGADLLLTHSTGILATKDTKPSQLIAVGAPLPVSKPRLAVRSLANFAQMIERLDDYEQGNKKVIEYLGSTAAELTGHPFANFKHIGKISTTNSIELAGAIPAPAILFYGEHDALYQPTDDQEKRAIELGVGLYTIPGQHYTLPLSPEDILPHVLR